MCRFGEREGERSVTEEVHKPIRVGEISQVDSGRGRGSGRGSQQKTERRPSEK